MAAIHLSDSGYQAIVTLAQERDITPDQLVESMISRLIDLEAAHETQEAQKSSDTAQDEIAARLEAIASDMYWEQLLEDPERASLLDALADEALADFAAGKTKPLSEIFGDDAL